MDRKAITELVTKNNQKASDLIRKMSLEEKVDLMGGAISFLGLVWDMMVRGHYNRVPYLAGGNPSHGIPPLKFCDGPRGLVPNHGTCFPVAMARGATFDVELQERVGEAIAREIRAVSGNYYGGVCVNLLRHPAGGRAQETYGEDPWHVGQMGAALTRGIQRHNVIACVKHFALNNQENTRFKINVECDERVLREVYLPHFKVVIEAGAASVMGAYNKFRGVHCCHNNYLLRTILKQEWGFEGFVISDFNMGVRDTVEAANGGCDIEMASTRFYGKRLVKAVRMEKVAEKVINQAVSRIIRILLAFTDSPDPDDSYPESLIASPKHTALALETAEKAFVLLKNENKTLPFDRACVKKLAVLGTTAVEKNLGDHGSSRVHPPYVVTPLQGLQNHLGTEVEIRYTKGKKISEAKALAEWADAVIFVLGCRRSDEGEYIYVFGGDRDNLNLRQAEINLIQSTAPLNPNSVVVLIGGSAIMVEDWKDKVPAILHAFYPGMEGGTAIAKVLFGQVNPGGKLPFIIPTSKNHLPPFDKRATVVTYDLYHGYTKLDREGNEPAFAFGFGLSYTTFEFRNAVFKVKGDQIQAAVQVTNNGDRPGDEVIQLYVGFDNSTMERPHKLLKGFKRIGLQPGETRAVLITCPIENLRWYNPETSSWQLEHMEYQAYIGSSSRPEDLLSGTFFI